MGPGGEPPGNEPWRKDTWDAETGGELPERAAPPRFGFPDRGFGCSRSRSRSPFPASRRWPPSLRGGPPPSPNPSVRAIWLLPAFLSSLLPGVPPFRSGATVPEKADAGPGSRNVSLSEGRRRSEPPRGRGATSSTRTTRFETIESVRYPFARDERRGLGTAERGKQPTSGPQLPFLVCVTRRGGGRGRGRGDPRGSRRIGGGRLPGGHPIVRHVWD
mmetsp:Transcript_6155/g.15118  ORF Transcript_6155/g.15118 Transcript_6155/m.15118 type:complete len:217 (-) Transcript_6155:905-1555(-)